MKRQKQFGALLGFFGRNNFNKHNPIRSYDLDERLIEIGVDPSLTQEALTRGYLMSEPSHTNCTLYGGYFHWIWLTSLGAAHLV